jgi:hypothetical protein
LPNFDIATNFTFKKPENLLATSRFSCPYSLNAEHIHIYEDWADTLNAANGSTRVVDALLQFGIKPIEDAMSGKITNFTKATFKPAYDFFEATIAQLLAKTIAIAIF